MRNCDCPKWKKYIGRWVAPENPYNSSKASAPMYHGVVIYYCPWCGHKLKKEKSGMVITDAGKKVLSKLKRN